MSGKQSISDERGMGQTHAPFPVSSGATEEIPLGKTPESARAGLQAWLAGEGITLGKRSQSIPKPAAALIWAPSKLRKG
jgi:hypothetical protein